MIFTCDPLDKGRKLNVHKTFRRRPERLMYVQLTFCVQGVSKIQSQLFQNPLTICVPNTFSSFMTEVPIIKKLVSWFAFKSIGWFLHDRNFRHERVNSDPDLRFLISTYYCAKSTEIIERELENTNLGTYVHRNKMHSIP